jgi:MOSC domain-containing protein YiiM
MARSHVYRPVAPSGIQRFRVARVSAVSIGEYTFSGTDVRKTLAHAIDLLDLYPEHIYPAQRQRRERIELALDDVDVARDDLTMLESALRVVWPELLAARDDLVAVCGLPATATGVIARVSASDGGVPKAAVERAQVGFGGVVGDRQATRVHHGRPWQALCIWSTEVIEMLALEGHPIAPGSAGENVTLSGLAWPDVRPGVRLRLGSVLCQVTSFAVPCKQNARWFVGGEFNRIHFSRGPVSRVYAVVLEPGTVATGDSAVLEPDVHPTSMS